MAKAKQGAGDLCCPGGTGSDGRLLKGTLRIPEKVPYLEFYSGGHKIMAKSKCKEFLDKEMKVREGPEEENATFFVVEA